MTSGSLTIRGIVVAAALWALPVPAHAAHFGDALAYYFLEDYKAAHAEWRTLAAEGDRNSQFYLGLLYETGRGVDQDIDTAIEWYRKAADAGHAEAAHRLAGLARQADTLPAAPETVLAWIETAAMGGVAEAQYELAALYAEGRIVERDLDKARQWFAEAEKSFTAGAKQRQAAKMRQLIEARLR